MAQAAGFRLTDIHTGDTGRQDVAHLLQQGSLTLLLQLLFQLVGLVEMIENRVLVIAGNENQFLGTCRDGFLHRVLDERLVDDRKHFLGIGLGRRKKPGAQTRHRKDRFA